MAFRIDKLTLNGFRSLRETTVRLGDLNVVIGVNGAGKSNFEDGFELLRAIASRRFQEFVGRPRPSPCCVASTARTVKPIERADGLGACPRG